MLSTLFYQITFYRTDEGYARRLRVAYRIFHGDEGTAHDCKPFLLCKIADGEAVWSLQSELIGCLTIIYLENDA